MLCKTIAGGRPKPSANRLARKSSGATEFAPAFAHVARDTVESGKRTASAERELERRRQAPGE